MKKLTFLYEPPPPRNFAEVNRSNSLHELFYINVLALIKTEVHSKLRINEIIGLMDEMDKV